MDRRVRNFVNSLIGVPPRHMVLVSRGMVDGSAVRAPFAASASSPDESVPIASASAPSSAPGVTPQPRKAAISPA